MIRIAIILILFSGPLFGQKVMTKPYRYFVPFTGEVPDPLFDYGKSVTYHYNDLAADYDKAGEVVAEIIDNDKFDIPDLPSKGVIEQGQNYKWNGMVVSCRQTHNRTIYDPTATLALFTIYRPESVDMAWISGEKVDVGTLRIFKDVKYEAIQAHVTQSDWTPDKSVTLWKIYATPEEIPVWKQPTGAHDAYNIGDKVHYPKITDSVYESKINANVWSPVTYPAGWGLIK